MIKKIITWIKFQIKPWPPPGVYRKDFYPEARYTPPHVREHYKEYYDFFVEKVNRGEKWTAYEWNFAYKSISL